MLLDAFGRVHEEVPQVLRGLDEQQLRWYPGPRANSIAWLVWHLTRVQDDHLAGVADSEQLWLSEGWEQRFGLPLEPRDIGYGHTVKQSHQVFASAELLASYHEAVHLRTVQIIASLTGADLERIIDRRWDPPVTVAVRLVSVVNDITQHVGQAAYLRGLLQVDED